MQPCSFTTDCLIAKNPHQDSLCWAASISCLITQAFECGAMISMGRCPRSWSRTAAIHFRTTTGSEERPVTGFHCETAGSNGLLAPRWQIFAAIQSGDARDGRLQGWGQGRRLPKEIISSRHITICTNRWLAESVLGQSPTAGLKRQIAGWRHAAVPAMGSRGCASEREKGLPGPKVRDCNFLGLHSPPPMITPSGWKLPIRSAPSLLEGEERWFTP